MENTGDYFSLQWNNFKSSLTEGFHDFLQEEAMVDVTLAAEGKFLRAHKLVLSVCSPYFKNLFKVNPCEHPIVILKDVGHNELSDMLEFMYKGEVGVKHEDLPSFLKLADTLNVKGLSGEKILNDNHSSKSINSNMVRVRKKIYKSGVSDVNKENSEFQSCSEHLEKKVVKSKKRKLPHKSGMGKKIKSEKFDNNLVNKCEEKSSDNSSEGKDSIPLTKLVGSDNVKSGGSSKQSEFQCDNENESECDNKTSFSVWSDDIHDIPDSNDSDGPRTTSFLQSNYSEEAEQTPQDPKIRANTFGPHEAVPCKPRRCALCSRSRVEKRTRWMCSTCFVPLCRLKTRRCFRDFHKLRSGGRLGSLIISRASRAFVWDYFLKETHQAICLNCGKTFKGQRPNTICEKHLKNRHPEFYKILLEKKIKRAELHMNPSVRGLGIPSWE